jgi:hypothetical protein
MVSATEIIADIATKGEGEYKITWKVFKEVQDLLSNKRAKSAYFPSCQVILSNDVYGRSSYNSVTGILRFLMPTWIHASAAEWIRQWVDGMKTSGDIETEGIRFFNDVTLEDFKLAYNRR